MVPRRYDKNKAILAFALSSLLFMIVMLPDNLQLSYAFSEIDAEVVAIDVYFWQHGITINSHTNKVYLVNNGQSIEVYNGSNFEHIRTIPESYYPHIIVANPITDTIYVSHSCNCEGGRFVSVIDGTTDRVMKTIDTVMQPMILVNQATNKVYAANGTAISVIDGNTNSLQETRFFDLVKDEYVALMDINPTENIAYGFDQNKTLVVVDLDTLTLTRSNITLATSRYENAVDSIIQKMVVNPNSNVLFALERPGYECVELCYPPAYIVTINATSSKIIHNDIPATGGFMPDLALDTKRNVVYVMDGSGDLTTINGTTNSIIDSYSIPAMREYSPRGLVVNSETGAVSVVAPNGVVTVPSESVVPEFGLLAPLIAAVGIFSIVFATRYLDKKTRNVF